MLHLTIKNLWAHKLRMALTSLAVVIGVGFMAGTMILTDTMGATFDRVFETTNAGVDVVVQQPAAVESQGVEVRARVASTTLDRIREVDGVDVASGSVQGVAQLVGSDGEVTTLDGLGATIGGNWIPDERLNPFTLASGRAPRASDEAVLDARTARLQGWKTGDTFTVLAHGEPAQLTLVGTATFGVVDGIPGSTFVAVEDEVAQRLFAEPGTYDAIEIAAAEGISATTLARRVEAALGHDTFEVVTGTEDSAAKQSTFHDDLSFFNTFLLAFAFIALFVGTFIIYNTFSILVAQRTRDMAMLRAVGASRGQLLRSVIVESAIVGVVAGALGLVFGVVMSFGLKGMLGVVGVEIPSGPTVVSATTIVTAFVVGLAVTLVSAVGPAIQGSRVRPMAALRESAVDRSASSTRRALVGVVMTTVGAMGFAVGVAGNGDAALQLLGVGALLTIMGVFVLGPVICRPIVGALGTPIARWGVAGRLARGNATRNPKRTAATATALMVGVALVGFITILAASTKASVASAVDQSLRADYVVDSGAFGEGGFSPTLAATLASLPEVDVGSGLRSTPATVGSESTTLGAVDTATIGSLYDLSVTRGAMTQVTGDTIAISSDVARDQGLRVGDTLVVTVAEGPLDLRVAAIFEESLAGQGTSDYLVDVSTFETHVADQYDQVVYLRTDDRVDRATSRAAIDRVLEGYPNATLEDQASFKEGITADINQIIQLVYALLALALLIALIGIVNTLALSVHERRREIGLLRAVGMSRAQVRTTVRWESVMISLFGVALGCLLAIVGGWGIVQALADQDVSTFALPTGQLVVIAMGAGVAGVLAAVHPARRAARLDVLHALNTA
jgi:putative ABC transport system permease protein